MEFISYMQPALLLILHVALQCSEQTNAVLYRHTDESERLETGDGIHRRISGIRDRENKDFVLGGLFPIHAEDPNFGGGGCGAIRVDQEIEAMLFALDSINARSDLLWNLTVGYDIRDTCYSTNIGLDEALDLIVAGGRIDFESCNREFEGAGEANAANTSAALTVGIVGALSSRVSVPVASLGRLFRVPQISYGSTSPFLSNRNQHSYFYRTIPPDDLQAKAMVELMLYFNWTHISTIYSNDAYGQPGIAELHALAAESGICIDLNEPVEESFVSEDYERIAHKLVESDANVVVIFAAHQNAEQILEKVSNTSARRRFTWFASDTWARSLPIAHRFNETVVGMFGVSPLSPRVSEFTNYLSQLTVNSNTRNPWFKDLYAAFANCSLTTSSSRDICDRNQGITELPAFEQSVYTSQVIDAVYTFAHALQNFLFENCDQPLYWNRLNNTCRGQTRQLNGSSLLEYIAMTNITSPTDENNRIIFDSLGNVEGKYEILNYQASDVGGLRQYGFQQVGIWDSSLSNESELAALQLNTSLMFQFGLESSGSILYSPNVSQCSFCTSGQYRRPVVSSCCGICDPCLGQNYSDDPRAPNCKNCSEIGEYLWGNNPTEGSNGCIQIPETYLSVSHPLSIVALIVSIIGLLCTVAVATIFTFYWKTPVIKSSGREQMILLLIGITLSFILTFIYISPPTLGICVIQRTGVWVAFSLMFGALFIKIIRVARIFFNKTSLKHLRFTEPQYQVLFTLLIVTGQILLTVSSIAYQVPGINRKVRLDEQNDNNLPEIVVTCNTDSIIFLVLSALYESTIIMASTILGVLSFKYPANFNEARFVSFCTFALLVFWLAFAFIPAYFVSQLTRELQSAATAFSVAMSAFAVLVCLFGRKVFIVLLRPKENIPKTSTLNTDAITLTTGFNDAGDTKDDKNEGSPECVHAEENGEARESSRVHLCSPYMQVSA